MKKFLLGAAAAMAIAAPGVASAQSGYIDASYQSSEVEIGGLEGDGDGFQAGGAVAWGGNGSLGVQLDALWGEAEDSTAINVGGHLFTRNDSHLLGAFVNLGNVDVDGGGDFDFWTAGIEGQLYIGRTTLDGAVSFGEGEDIDAELTAVDLGLTHFFTDNFSLGANVGFGNIDSTGGDADLSTLGVSAEYQFASAPFSIFGGYQHVELDDLDSSADTIGVGIRYSFGGSLFERNRNGASLSRGGGFGRYGGLL